MATVTTAPGPSLAQRLDTRHWRYAAAVALLAGAYWAAAKIGLQLAYLDGAVTALWPPVGVGIAALVLYGPRLWPGLVIGDLLVADFSSPTGTVLGQTLGNTLEILVAALILRRLVGTRPALTRTVEVFALVAAGAAGALLSASFGSTSLRLGDIIPVDEYGEVWRTWFLSDLSGALVVTPFILTWAAGGRVHFSRRQVVEGLALLATLVLLAELPSQRDVPYVVFPVLIWAALRFGPRGAATALLLASSLTVLNTANNAGPFVRDSITDSLLSTQLFLAAAALTSLVLAAVTAERSAAGGALRTNEDRLRSVLRSMGEGLVVRDARGLITDCNVAAERILGVRRGDLGGRRPEEVVTRATGEDGDDVPAERLLGGATGLVVRLERPDATWSWIAASSSPVRDAAGRLDGVVTTLSDITQRRVLAAEQAALRRIATLVAGDAPPRAVFDLVTEEIGRLLGLPSASIVRYESASRGTVVGSWVNGVDNGLAVGTRFKVEGDTVVDRVRRSGKPARIDGYQDATGDLAAHLRGQGYRSSVAAPVQVGGALWGALVVSAFRAEDLPPGAEARICDFAELVAQALANADAHEKLAASRIRLVEAGDAERRRLERNLHDGAQQRLVALAVHLRLIEGRLEQDPAGARDELDRARTELSEALTELRELARGIHPAVLTDRGLAAAVVGLADRAPVPVDIASLPEGRLPPGVEAAAYYIISEAVTNVAKYASASHVSVAVRDDGERTFVEVRDDGIGGADPSDGSGLRGIADRVEALHGRLEVTSPPGAGTCIEAEIPSRR